MKVYLASFKIIEKHWEDPTDDIYLLSSFWEHKSGKYGEYVKQERHILDSGAFSALSGAAKNVDWKAYTIKYIKFINDTKQKLFLEMDIDSLVGIEKVEYYRSMIEDGTGLACIPAWHKARGKDYWLRLIEDYEYVAIGGIVSREIKREEYVNLEWFLKTARKAGTKVHGLGFTNMQWLGRLPFYSVDSTSWIPRFKGLPLYANGRISSISVPDGNRWKTYSIDRIKYGFNEWIKFQKYAEENL